MEVFWASRFHNNSGVKTAHHNFTSENHTNLDGIQGDDDSRAYFPCPFCYVEIELHVLCNHLQEEHCFALNNAVCPLCAANLGKDALGHFTMQHSHAVKRKRKSQKSGFWSNYPTTMGKDFREMSEFFGSGLISGRSNVQEQAPDPLLSPFLRNMSLSEPRAEQEDTIYNTTTSLETSDTPVLLNKLSEQDYEETTRKAAFAQELIFSAIFEV